MVALIMFGCLVVVFPLALSQQYMATATGKLTKLDSMSQVHYVPSTKYYTVKKYYPSKGLVHIKMHFYVSGKNNADFNMDAYTAVPVFDRVYPDTNRITIMRNRVNPKTLVIVNDTLSNMPALKKLPADSVWMMRYINPTMVMPKYGDAGKYGALAVVTKSYKFKKGPPTNKIAPAAWLVFKYHKAISNNLKPDEKQVQFIQFTKHCEADFKKEPLNKAIYMARLPYDDETAIYLEAINSREDVVYGEHTLLSPVYTSFNKRNGNKLALIIGLFFLTSAFFLLMLELAFKVDYQYGVQLGIFKERKKRVRKKIMPIDSPDETI
ncbi:hypothetical protein AAFN85_30475 [Mucilaginibacter sp. CAU 1740]|uniref:hypothetical protein n=1 Tax=Mucilaginibacter sp. CAU 1740 TaxID=3140365 RepID=UPI00325AA854